MVFFAFVFKHVFLVKFEELHISDNHNRISSDFCLCDQAVKV